MAYAAAVRGRGEGQEVVQVSSVFGVFRAADAVGDGGERHDDGLCGFGSGGELLDGAVGECFCGYGCFPEDSEAEDGVWGAEGEGR